jgi:hypothetical protein
MNQRRGISFLNVLTAMFFFLAFVAIVAVAVIFLVPDLVANTPLANLFGSTETVGPPTPTTAAVAVVPSRTPSPTPNSLVATWTPVAALPTATPRPSNTPGPTLTPSLVPTFPTKTPTPTRTPTPTNTPTETPIGPTPTPSPTRSAFPFTKTNNSPFYLQNYANSAGCNWLGIAGEVLDLNRNPVPSGQFVVHVWGDGVDQRPDVGGAPAYSPSGWEQFVSNTPVIRNYNVQLETTNGTAVSEVYTVQTRASCNQNLVRLDFVQNH